ncbi:hypothetical protein L1987_09039 [Smallanthus sonchifolius]|uniref:Uncharacterized protein n=1 Tax=Smallanthus sonchifolius TaxID=185202 RepID=A0ACB9JNX9_9ASTR|nr:hypothetical protein L1987_09039 [Smallanthus sonchifolius]
MCVETRDDRDEHGWSRHQQHRFTRTHRNGFLRAPRHTYFRSSSEHYRHRRRLSNRLLIPQQPHQLITAFAFVHEMYTDFGVDGGSAAKAFTPKFNVLSKHFTTHTGFQVPEFEIKFLVAVAIALKSLGSFLFVFGSTIGATLLILH